MGRSRLASGFGEFYLALLQKRFPSRNGGGEGLHFAMLSLENVFSMHLLSH